MKFWVASFFCILSLQTGTIAYAQDATSFSNTLLSNLEAQYATATYSSGPALGTSENIRGSGEPPDPAFEPYDAGQDTVSGVVATGAAVLGALAIILVFAIVATSRHGEYGE